MSSLSDTKTKLERIQDEKLKTQERIRQLKQELLSLESQSENRGLTPKSELEYFIDSLSEHQIKTFILTLFKEYQHDRFHEYSKVIENLDATELINASISNTRRYLGAFVVTYCLLELNMPCKDISKKFNKSRSWATYKAIEILFIRLKKYIDTHYDSHIVHYRNVHTISSYGRVGVAYS